MRRLPRLTGRGAIALGLVPVSTVAGFLLGAEELVLLAVAMAAFLVVGLVQCTSRRQRANANWRMTVHLESADIARGSPSLMTVVIVAEGRGSAVPVRLADPSGGWDPASPAQAVSPPPPPSAPGPAHAVQLPPLMPGGTVTLRFPIPTEHRGIFRLSGVHLWCFDSLALFASRVASGPGATVTILPVPIPVDVRADLLQGVLSSEELPISQQHTRRARQDMGDFAGLRPYVPGDRLRLLYWPALARTGDLMVRDFEDTGSRRFSLVADIRPHLGPRGIEVVLAACASAGLQALASGAVVEFSTTDHQQFAIGPGPHAELALLRELAAIVAGPIALSPDQHGVRLPGTPVVVTTSGGAATLPPGMGSGPVLVVS